MITVYEPTALIDPHTPNFRQYEMANSDYAKRHGIDNTPPLFVLNNAVGVAINCLQPIRNKFGLVSINSWYRSEPLEKVMTVDGFKKWCAKRNYSHLDSKSWDKYFLTKQHPKGSAVDFEIPGVANDDVFEWCKNNLKFDQLIREFARDNDPASGWIHISWSAEDNDQEVLHIG